MNKYLLAALTASFLTVPAIAADAPTSMVSAAVVAAKGKMLVAADGSRLAPVYRVAEGAPQIILDGRMVTVPSNTVAMVDGKLTTSLTKAQVIALP
jgi:hypothetical protein